MAAAAIWGGMYVVSKIVLDFIPPFSLISLRLLIGIAVLWVIIKFQGGTGFSWKQKLHAISVGCIGYGVSLGFQFIGTHLSTASNGSLVTSATPAFVLLFAFWLLKERITWKRLAALAVSSVGVLLVIDLRTASLSPDLFLGNLSLVVAALTWALYSVMVRKVTQNLAVLPATMIFFVGGLLVSIPASYLELRNIPIGSLTFGILLGVLYLGVISTAGAMYLWNMSFSLLEANTASLTFFAQPIVGSALGAIFLGEQLSLMFYLGGMCIGFGIWLAASS